MKLRSRGLAAAGLLLLASAAALGAVLTHDGSAASVALADAEPGQHVEVKGAPQPFAPEAPLRAWDEILPLLHEHTYWVDAEADGAVALLTADEAAPEGVAVAEGVVTWTGEHPTRPGTTLIVVQVSAWREPLLFR